MGGKAGVSRMLYLESASTDPYYNLALEQVVFDGPGQHETCCMLWQNHNTIVVGKHQNTLQEVNMAYVREHDVRVARRLSGGGAVYHDMGNVNFTFIAPHRGVEMDFSAFCRPVAAALAQLGVTAEISGRNDMTIDGKKFSGNSQYIKHGRVMHHGTILYDSDLSVVGLALRVPEDKIISKGLQSVRSRVTNVRPYVKEDLPTSEFLARLRRALWDMHHMEPLELTPEQLERTEHLRKTLYSTWEWNFGASPPCQIVKKRRIEGCGQLEIHMDVEQGAIRTLHFYGDYFSVEEPEELAGLLLGCPLEEKALSRRLEGRDPARYFRGLDRTQFLGLLLQ